MGWIMGAGLAGRQTIGMHTGIPPGHGHQTMGLRISGRKRLNRAHRNALLDQTEA
jgi:hypothetical protein